MKKILNKKIIVAIIALGIILALVLILFQSNNNYEIQINKIDDFSPDRELIVLKDGKPTEYELIKYTSEVVLCYSKNPTVSFTDIEGVEEVIVVLKNKKEIKVKLNES